MPLTSWPTKWFMRFLVDENLSPKDVADILATRGADVIDVAAPHPAGAEVQIQVLHDVGSQRVTHHDHERLGLPVAASRYPAWH